MVSPLNMQSHFAIFRGMNLIRWWFDKKRQANRRRISRESDASDLFHPTGAECNQDHATAFGIFEGMSQSAPPIIDQSAATPAIDTLSPAPSSPDFSSAASSPSYDCGSTYSDSGSSVDFTC